MSYKKAYEQFIDKLSGIEHHYETDEGQNVQFSIAIQDEYEKFWNMVHDDEDIYRVTTANLDHNPVSFIQDEVVAESPEEASVMVEKLHHARGFTNRCEVECEVTE
tara:strand:- start:7 stop:324 length:318 start_codon:yes stop_codon:yes gene_type:complete